MTLPLPARLPEGWAALLANVQQSLAKAEQDAERSALAIDGLTNAPAPAASATAVNPADDALRRLVDGVAQADAQLQETEQALQQSLEALQQWLVQTQAARQNLANRADLSV